MVRSHARLRPPGHAGRAFQMATIARGRLRLHLGSSAKLPRQIVKCLSVSDDRPIQLLRVSAHVDRACRMGINAPAPLLPQQSPREQDNTRPKYKRGCIARVILSFGQILILTSTISPELGTTAPQ